MARKLRFTPEGGALFEITCRTVHSRLLLRPSRLLNEIIVGALARAKRRYSVELCAFVFMSNHFHLIVRVEDSEQLARFMCYFSSKLAREVRARRHESGRQPPGPAAICSQRPFDQPAKTKRSPAPRFHAVSERIQKGLYNAYAWFIATFREAADALRDGNRMARFPEGSFPPGLPFVWMAG